MLETVLWASLAATIAAARWSEFATGPSISGHDVMLPLLLGLVPALIINLVVLIRATAPAKPSRAQSESEVAT